MDKIADFVALAKTMREDSQVYMRTFKLQACLPVLVIATLCCQAVRYMTL